MSRHRFTITFEIDGTCYRAVYQADETRTGWIRRREVRTNGEWRRQHREAISAPTLEVHPLGVESFAGP